MRARLRRIGVAAGVVAVVAAAPAMAQVVGVTRSGSNPAPKAMVGTWSRYVPKSAFTRYKAPTDVGIWRIKIQRTGLFSIFNPETSLSQPPTLKGAIRVTGASASFEVGCTTSNKYTWKVSATGKLLTFTRVSDPKCKQRAAVMTGYWKKRS